MPVPILAAAAGGLAAGAASGASSGLFGTLFGGWNARRQWKYQRKAMELQQQYALEQMAEQSRLQRAQFDYENEYNSPVNVFNRYRQAGINPAAVLGSSGASMSATMPMPGAPSGGHVSGGPAIGGMEHINIDPVAASQIKYNNAAAENQQSSANLSDEKAVTEQSVRNMLAATVDEKVMNTYFTQQKAFYQQLVNVKTPEMLDAQIAELTAHADQLIASANLSEAQIGLVKEQTANVYFDSQLKKAETNTQTELGKLYASERGFVSLRAEDLRRNIQALTESNKYETIKYVDGIPQRRIYTIDGYEAKALALKLGAMIGCADATTAAIRASWSETNEWTHTVDTYWDNVNGSISSVGGLILKGEELPIKRQAVNVRSAGSVTSTEYVNGDGEVIGGTHTVRRPYRP